MRRLLKRIFWLGCLVGTAAAVWLYNYLYNDEFLRSKAQTLLEEHCPDADVQLGAARRNSDGTISLLGLHFTQRFATVDVDLDVPEIKLRLAKDGSATTVTGVELYRPRLRVATDGEFWQDESTWLDKLTSDLPPVRVHKGSVELVQGLPQHVTTQPNVSVTSIAPDGQEEIPRNSERADSDPVALRLRNVNLNVGSVADHSLRVAGTASSDLFDRVDLAVRIGATRKAWALSVDFQDVRFDRNLHQMIAKYLPDAARHYVAAPRPAGGGTTGWADPSVVRPAGGPPDRMVPLSETSHLAGWAIQGRGRVRLTLHRTENEQPMIPQLAVKLENSSLAAPLLPFPIHGIDALVVYRDGVAQLLEFRGRNGATELSARGTLPFPFSRAEPPAAALRVKADNLELDERLRGRLPAAWQRQWERYRPGGIVNVEFSLVGQGPYHIRGAVLRCLDASFRFHKFPYRLEHVTGSIEQQGEALDVTLSAPAARGTVRLTGTIAKPGPNATVSLNIDADRVALDERKLRRALSPEARELLSTLDARGSAEVHWQLRRDDPLDHYEQSARVVLNGASVRWKGYPIDQIEGTLQFADGTWRSSDLRGRNDDGLIGASGMLGPRGEGFPFELKLHGKHVQLERELRDTLAPRWRELWAQMAVGGRCDFAATLTGAHGRNVLLHELQLLPRDASFRPVGFSLRFSGLNCRRGGGIRIVPDQDQTDLDQQRRAPAQTTWKVQFQGIQAQHGPSRWQSSGSLRIYGNGRRRLTLQHLAVDRLAFDAPLLAALPPDLARACRQLNPTGPSFRLREADTGPALVLEWFDAVQASRRATWNLVLLCDNASLAVGGGMRGITGALSFEGVYRDGTLECLGEVALERCTWRDLHFTKLHGPLSITKSQAGAAPTRVVLGNWKVSEQAPGRLRPTSIVPSADLRHLSATLLGGRVIGDIKATVGRSSTYELRAHLNGGRLEQYAAQVLPGRKRVQGRLTADWYLKSSADPGAVEGWGYLVAENGDLYDLPLVFNLLPVAWNILNLKRAESPSVHSGSVALRLGPEEVAVQQMELVSDTVTFRGKGRMKALNAESPIQLIFYPVMTTNRSRVPLIGALIDQASKELVEFHVEGSLKQPKVLPRYIPNVDGAIQEIGSMGDTGIRKAVQTLRRILDVQP